jgi:hypothetical protein
VRLERRRTFPVAVALVAAAMLASARVALAVFTHTAAGGPLTVVSSTLAPPTNPTAIQIDCHSNRNPEIQLAWSATSSTYASSYEVERATAAAGPYTQLASVPIGETSYTDRSGSLTYSTVDYYRVSAMYRAWSGASATVSVKTLSKFC